MLQRNMNFAVQHKTFRPSVAAAGAATAARPGLAGERLLDDEVDRAAVCPLAPAASRDPRSRGRFRLSNDPTPAGASELRQNDPKSRWTRHHRGDADVSLTTAAVLTNLKCEIVTSARNRLATGTVHGNAANGPGGTMMAQTDTATREAERMARRQADPSAHVGGGWGERAAHGLDRAFNGQLVGTQSEIMNLVVQTMSEQARQNLEFALDLTGARGPERLMQCQNHYWSDTMARAQRFQNDLMAITQRTARTPGGGGR
jgi:hypothetical protein